MFCTAFNIFAVISQRTLTLLISEGFNDPVEIPLENIFGKGENTAK